MQVKALKTFVGVVSMNKGDVKDISNIEVLQALLQAKFVEEVGKVNVEDDEKEKNRTRKKKKC